jgi:hypothetical protein
MAAFWAELQPLTLVTTTEEARSIIPAVLDVVLRHSFDDSQPDDDLVRHAVSELSAFFITDDDGDNEDLTPSAWDAAFAEVMGLMVVEIQRCESARLRKPRRERRWQPGRGRKKLSNRRNGPSIGESER